MSATEPTMAEEITLSSGKVEASAPSTEDTTMEDADALETEPLFAQREAMDTSSTDQPKITSAEAGGKAKHPKHKKKNDFLFRPLSAKEMNTGKVQVRKVQIPPHRMTPLKDQWMSIYEPLVQHLKLQIRMNIPARQVEMRTCPQTIDAGAIQKAADFVRAFALGFQVQDAMALLRLDDLYIDSFEIKDVKTLQGDHLSRAIGRIAGRDGKTKFAIENASRTRVVLADTKIHILGSFQNIRMARDALVSLVLGSPPGKVYAQLRTVANRTRERF